jgi:hypothetical protein
MNVDQARDQVVSAALNWKGSLDDHDAALLGRRPSYNSVRQVRDAQGLLESAVAELQLALRTDPT